MSVRRVITLCAVGFLLWVALWVAVLVWGPDSECTTSYAALLQEIETQVNTNTDPTPAQRAARREWIERCRTEEIP